MLRYLLSTQPIWEGTTWVELNKSLGFVIFIRSSFGWPCLILPLEEVELNPQNTGSCSSYNETPLHLFIIPSLPVKYTHSLKAQVCNTFFLLESAVITPSVLEIYTVHLRTEFISDCYHQTLNYGQIKIKDIHSEMCRRKTVRLINTMRLTLTTSCWLSLHGVAFNNSPCSYYTKLFREKTTDMSLSYQCTTQHG